MKFIIYSIIIAGGLSLYNKYQDHMKEFNKDRYLLQQEKVVYDKDEHKNKVLEANITKELKKVKEKNEKISEEPESTGVDFHDGNHILTI